MTDHELQPKAIALRRTAAGPAFQPEGLMEYSPGLREALPWVRVPPNSLHPEGGREPAASSPALAPLQGAKHFRALTQGSSRSAQATLGYILIALQATGLKTVARRSSAGWQPEFRRLAVGSASECQRIANPRHSRLPVCATIFYDRP